MHLWRTFIYYWNDLSREGGEKIRKYSASIKHKEFNRHFRHLKKKGNNMSVKIKISYNTEEELEKILQVLSPVLKDFKVARNKEGRYKKAYAEIKE